MKPKHIYFLSLSFLISVILTLFFYIVTFKHHSISNDPNDWATFSNYLGGILNPVIGIFNVIMIGYLTYVIHKESSKSDDDRFINQRKLDAYEELAKKLPVLQSTNERLQQIIKFHTWSNSQLKDALEKIKKAANVGDKEHGEHLLENLNKEFSGTKPLVDLYNKVIQIANESYQFYFFIFHFELRYSHLFSYDFDNDEYNELVDLSRKYYESNMEYANRIIDASEDKIISNDDNSKFFDLLTEFVNQIRDEIDFTNSLFTSLKS